MPGLRHHHHNRGLDTKVNPASECRGPWALMRPQERILFFVSASPKRRLDTARGGFGPPKRHRRSGIAEAVRRSVCFLNLLSGALSSAASGFSCPSPDV